MTRTIARGLILFLLLVLSCAISQQVGGRIQLLAWSQDQAVSLDNSWNVVWVVTTTLTVSLLTTLVISWLGAKGLNVSDVVRLFLVTLCSTALGIIAIEALFRWIRARPYVSLTGGKVVALLVVASLAGGFVGLLQFLLLGQRLRYGYNWSLLMMAVWFISMLFMSYMLYGLLGLAPP